MGVLPVALMLIVGSPSFFKYTHPESGLSFSVCSCPKCGSSSIYRALHAALHNGTEKADGLPFMGAFSRWKAPGVSASTSPGLVHFHVVRDPIERYISAWHSKIKCCPNSTTRPCMSDYRDRWMATRLAVLNGLDAATECLTFDAYVQGLAAQHRAGAMRQLNRHYRPQSMTCPLTDMSALTIRGNVSEVGKALAMLSPSYFTRPVHVLHRHATVKPGNEVRSIEDVTGTTLRALCELSRQEYAWLQWPVPVLCMPGR